MCDWLMGMYVYDRLYVCTDGHVRFGADSPIPDGRFAAARAAFFTQGDIAQLAVLRLEMERHLLEFASYSKTALKTPKMHALRHDNITELGALVGASANIPESQHKKYAKDPYRNSNKQSKTFARQIVRLHLQQT
jgi:hypothetical protein